ncbi:MAG: MarR family winged helix-turn-helix transcriptional regulator [Christensenellaceae bacterium]
MIKFADNDDFLLTYSYVCDIILTVLAKKEYKMELSVILDEMKSLSQSRNWKNLIGLIDDGYKGMFVILRILQESQTSVVAGELAKRMNVSTARIARALNTLENKKYIRREMDDKDARKVIIRLTELGEQALEERKRIIKNMLEPMLENLTKQEINTFFSLLKKLLQ